MARRCACHHQHLHLATPPAPQAGDLSSRTCNGGGSCTRCSCAAALATTSTCALTLLPKPHGPSTYPPRTCCGGGSCTRCSCAAALAGRASTTSTCASALPALPGPLLNRRSSTGRPAPAAPAPVVGAPEDNRQCGPALAPRALLLVLTGRTVGSARPWVMGLVEGRLWAAAAGLTLRSHPPGDEREGPPAASGVPGGGGRSEVRRCMRGL